MYSSLLEAREGWQHHVAVCGGGFPWVVSRLNTQKRGGHLDLCSVVKVIAGNEADFSFAVHVLSCFKQVGHKCAAMAWQFRSATGVEYGSSLGITAVIHIKNDASKCFIAVIAWKVEHLFPCEMMIS